MARKSPAEKLKMMRKVTSAWELRAPGSTFFGLTLDGFKAVLKPSHDSRAQIEDLENRLRAAIKGRDAADVRSMRAVRGVVFGVKGDPEHTEDGALYASMGYVPRSARRKRRRRKE
jgi:hypothetical protein